MKKFWVFDEGVKVHELSVTCQQCGCFVNPSFAQEIKLLPRGSGSFWYCREHRRQFDEIAYRNDGIVSAEYYKRIQCDRDGEPIGYVKAKDKKR